MIHSFKDKALKRFAETGETGKLPVENVGRVARALSLLDKARKPEDLNIAGWHFHELRGRRKGTYAVRITGNWRLTFQWADGAVHVALEDYH